MSAPPGLWAVFTVGAAAAQTLRNALQRDLIAVAGTAGATYVRFLFGLPFALLFLAGVEAATGAQLPPVDVPVLGWILLGAVAQIGATALMLAAMRERSFVVTVAYTKTEPIQVAVFGLVVLGDQVTIGLATAIVVATVGVMVMSWPQGSRAETPAHAWRPAGLGVASGACFALAVVGFRGAEIRLQTPSFVVAATLTLVIGLAMQTLLVTLYLALVDRAALQLTLRAWRRSIGAGFMGAAASQMWFLAFALQTGARVRTLGLLEVLFASLVSRRVLAEAAGGREWIGVGLIVAGVVLLLNV